MSNLDPQLRGSLWSALLSIFTSSSTLLCCALPALLVTLGAGATLAGLVSAVPQLVWLSAHKGLVFGAAGAMLAVAGWLQLRARNAPCPIDPQLAAACARTRRVSLGVYLFSLAIYGVGLVFAFLLPLLD
ncbi:hypothetical protein D0B54_16655 [Solimonas sp. K1W22B-7]|uniref:hypothetical protein n=1 Tax=Solimonas sp. K1W22B-7 TaxID=2303331 RepID=UPI000E3327B8|nr:hypothetical protein [Solimonas sp. K1W22B-7]AXQ30205.1 hypothetical protein D0B54_16655 [Solimonas sp. K1W22B-7]